MIEKILPEIERYNEVNRKNFEIPSYDATQAERRIELYFNNAGEVVIIGWAGVKYIYWLSVTKTEDVELNERIYTRIANEPLTYVTCLSKALGSVNLTCGALEEYYKAELKWKPEPRRKKEILATWETPFGRVYTKEEAEKNGGFFACDVRQYIPKLHAQCQCRECGGSYIVVLKQYAEELKATTEYDDRVRVLQELLETEAYLILSQQEEISMLFRYCRTRCKELQNN